MIGLFNVAARIVGYVAKRPLTALFADATLNEGGVRRFFGRLFGSETLENPVGEAKKSLGLDFNLADTVYENLIEPYNLMSRAEFDKYWETLDLSANLPLFTGAIALTGLNVVSWQTALIGLVGYNVITQAGLRDMVMGTETKPQETPSGLREEPRQPVASAQAPAEPAL